LNTQAYEYYLRANYLYKKREDIEDVEVVRGLLHKTIELDDSLLIAKRLLGDIHKDMGNLNEAMDIYTPILKQAEDLGDKAMIGKLLVDMAIVFENKGDYEQSFEYYTRSYKIFEEVGNKYDMTRGLIGIGDYYINVKDDFDKSNFMIDIC
jgi:tetratricopeptide (TPR) repeat protein